MLGGKYVEPEHVHEDRDKPDNDPDNSGNREPSPLFPCKCYAPDPYKYGTGPEKVRVEQE